MNYKKIYDSIISNAKQRDNSTLNIKYFENHHIIPKCIGGTNDKNNLVKLTLREHYICHKLLAEIYPTNKKIIQAFWIMTTTTYDALKRFNENNETPQRVKHLYDENKLHISSIEYQYAKQLYSETLKGNNITSETKIKISQITREKMKNSSVIEKCRSGSLGCHYYRNKETNQVYKWFPGDNDIDLTFYEWGRGPLSKKQKAKISNIKHINKTWWFNEELNIKYCIYIDYINDIIPNGWIHKNPLLTTDGKFFKTFVNELKQLFVKNNNFDILDKMFYEVTLSAKKPRKLLSPSIIKMCFNFLKAYKETNDIQFIDNAYNYILSNIEELDKLNYKYIKRNQKQ